MPVSSASHISVVLLSYERPEMLAVALASIERQTRRPHEVIVVDNPSSRSPEVVAVMQRFPACRLISPATNLGFTGGMNLGIAHVSGDLVYLTEDDVELEPECLERLFSVLEADASIGLVGPVMLNRGSGSVRCAGGTFALQGIYRLAVVTELNEANAATPYATGYIPGASIGVRASLLRSIGAFREDFFMYCDDVDLCARVLSHQLAIVMVPGARVRHFEPAAGRVPDIVQFHKIKNLAALYLLNASATVLPEFVLRYGVLGFVRSLRGGHHAAALFLRSWWWVLRNLPRLLSDRRARMAQTGPSLS